MNWDPISSAQAKNRDEAGVSPRRGRILKGEKPGELPVQQSTKVEMFLKPQDRQGARPYYPAPAARPCRRGDRIAGLLLRRVSPLLALSGHPEMSAICPLSGVKRTCHDPGGHARADADAPLLDGSQRLSQFQRLASVSYAAIARLRSSVSTHGIRQISSSIASCCSASDSPSTR